MILEMWFSFAIGSWLMLRLPYPDAISCNIAVSATAAQLREQHANEFVVRCVEAKP